MVIKVLSVMQKHGEFPPHLGHTCFLASKFTEVDYCEEGGEERFGQLSRFKGIRSCFFISLCGFAAPLVNQSLPLLPLRLHPPLSWKQMDEPLSSARHVVILNRSITAFPPFHPRRAGFKSPEEQESDLSRSSPSSLTIPSCFGSGPYGRGTCLKG